MRSYPFRPYVAAVTLLVFFVLWAAIAAKPWASTARRQGIDPRLAALDRRQRRLAHEAQVVKRALDLRWRHYRRQLRQRQAQIRTLERQHAQQVAAAQAAGAGPSYASAGAAAPVASSATRVVTLPPQVKIVNVPPAAAPATSSGSSHP